MATPAPTQASNATRRKGGKRPPAEPANGPSIPSVNEDGCPSKKVKVEGSESPKMKIKKEIEDVPIANIDVKKEKEVGTSGDEQPDKENQNTRQILAFNWTSEELSQLIANLTACLPKSDNVKYSTLIEKLDWEKVRFSPYTAVECKEKWMQIMTKLRRFRTLTDMVTDAKEWLKHPWSSYSSSKKQKHPEMPKKPLTPYFRYFLEKRQKYSNDHPDMSMTDLAKILSKKYQQLPDKKKQKYKEHYEKENEVYKLDLERFKREHPEQFPTSEVKHPSTPHEGPFKPQTPFHLFLADRMKKAEFAEMDKKEATEKIRKLWSALIDSKRVKWIRKAVQDEQRFNTEVEAYTQTHPGFKPEQYKSIISKAEKEIKDRYDGKPDRPPNSGYSQFSRIRLREMKDVPSKEKMAQISKQWKQLSEQEREAYNKQAQLANEKYRELYAAYLKSLPEDERVKLENEVKGGKKKVITHENATTESNEKKMNSTEDGEEETQVRPKKPLSALFYFQQEKLLAFRQKNPDTSKQEAMRLLAREYTELPEKKKEKYKKLAEEAKKQYNEELLKGGFKEGPTEPGSRKHPLFKGEPRKPPQSGYSLFTTEMLGAVTDVDSKNRMAVTAKKWKALPDSEKEKYKKRVQELMKKYNKELEKFLANLTEAEREEYNRVRSKTKGGSKAAAPKVNKEPAAPAAKKVQEKLKTKKESESESSDDSSDNDDEDDDEEEEEENGSGKSDNGSGSGSDESGSDSDEDDDEEDDDDDSDDEKKDGDNDSSSGDSDSDSDSDSGSTDDSSESASESED